MGSNGMGSKWRTWTEEAEERLASLVQAVEGALEEGEGERAAREAVPRWAGCDTITELAEKAQVERSALSVCLAGEPGSPHWKIREALERSLELPPGGMTCVLSMVEAARQLTP